MTAVLELGLCQVEDAQPRHEAGAGQRGSMDALVSVGDAFVVLMVTVLGAGGGCSRRRPWPVMRRLGRELHVVHRLALGLLRGGLRHAQ